MSIIMLISLIILSLRKENYRNWVKVVLLYYIMCLLLVYESVINKNVNIFLWNYNIKIDSMACFLKGLIIIFMINYNFMIEKFFDWEKIYIREFFLIMWIIVIGIFFLLMSNEFFIIYLALELQNLILYMLTSLRRWRSKSIESAMKYYIMGSFSSGLLLYGIIMLFGYFGTLNFVELSYLIKDCILSDLEMTYVVYMCFFILVGLLFKLGIAPFHWWVSEIYEGAPLVVTLFFSLMPKLSLLIILYKFYISILIYLSFFFSYFFFFLSFLSLLIGFLFSLFQKKIVKFMAYSSIFNGGFFMACFANGSYLSLISVFYFFIPYMFLLLGIFFILIIFRKIKKEKFDLLWDFSLLSNSNKSLGFILSLFIFSLAGIPPLSGFFGKFFILLSVFLSKFYFLFFILISFSVFSSFYYFRLVRFIFFSNYLDYVFLRSYLNTTLLSFFLFLSLFFILFFDFIYIFFFNFLSYIFIS